MTVEMRVVPPDSTGGEFSDRCCFCSSLTSGEKKKASKYFRKHTPGYSIKARWGGGGAEQFIHFNTGLLWETREPKVEANKGNVCYNNVDYLRRPRS